MITTKNLPKIAYLALLLLVLCTTKYLYGQSNYNNITKSDSIILNYHNEIKKLKRILDDNQVSINRKRSYLDTLIRAHKKYLHHLREVEEFMGKDIDFILGAYGDKDSLRTYGVGTVSIENEGEMFNQVANPDFYMKYAFAAKSDPIVRYASMLGVIQGELYTRRSRNMYSYARFLIDAEHFLALYPNHFLAKEVRKTDKQVWKKFISSGFVHFKGYFQYLIDLYRNDITQTLQYYRYYLDNSHSESRKGIIDCIYPKLSDKKHITFKMKILRYDIHKIDDLNLPTAEKKERRITLRDSLNQLKEQHLQAIDSLYQECHSQYNYQKDN